MRISEIMPRHHETVRRVGIHFDTRQRAMTAAVELFHLHGLDVEIQETSLWIEAPRHLSTPVQQLLERACGVRGFNEWTDHTERETA